MIDSSNQEGEGKKKVNEVKTFPVPFTLGAIKEHISISTNTPNKLSKEQIINQAFKFHTQGNIQEAAKYYQYFISQGFKDHRVFSNYGVILKNLGKLKEAELLQCEAIKHNPDFADAHYNLGNKLRDDGKLKEAELSYRKAIEIQPGYANALLNLGNLMKDIGKLEEAELSYRKAIEIKPDFADAHYNMAVLFSGLGKLQDAFDSYLKTIDIDPTHSTIYSSITSFLKDSDPSQLNKIKLKYIIDLLLEKNDIPHKNLFNVFNFIYSNEIISNLEKFDSDISAIELLINRKVIVNALKKMIFSDIKLEKMLTKIRRKICDRISKNIDNINYSELRFIIALGEQCFLNEYVYSFTEEEKKSTNIIIQRCRDGEINEKNISILSCYFPLYKLLDQIPSLKSFNSSNQSFKALIECQITEHIKETELSQNIKKLGSINDKVSRKVKTQYEENPYPRWRYENHSENQKLSIMQVINNDINPNSIVNDTGNRQLKILIAGCGTGQQILHAQRYKNADITSIDLSLSSLSYAQRKINELGINNVELIQMDILEVSLLKEKFDIIECGGVLHHMNNPLQGLKALVGVLKNNGFLKLGLYSEKARQNIVEARNYIAKKKLQPNEDNIRNFRQKIISGELSELKSIKTIRDFYSLSQCRDLCFHAQEHRFTIKQLQETLKSNELKFLGFILSTQIKSLHNKYFPEDKKQTNLQNWEKFEVKYPTTFVGMYQFWVSKTKI